MNCEKPNMKCADCGKTLETQNVRFVILQESQKCLWVAANELPEVDVADSLVLGYYCGKDHALAAVRRYLIQVGAAATFSDVRPIEACACCSGDIAANQLHMVITLSTERGSEDEPELLDIDYPARFCNTCVPIT